MFLGDVGLLVHEIDSLLLFRLVLFIVFLFVFLGIGGPLFSLLLFLFEAFLVLFLLIRLGILEFLFELCVAFLGLFKLLSLSFGCGILLCLLLVLLGLFLLEKFLCDISIFVVRASKVGGILGRATWFALGLSLFLSSSWLSFGLWLRWCGLLLDGLGGVLRGVHGSIGGGVCSHRSILSFGGVLGDQRVLSCVCGSILLDGDS
jgi:hypothetical protein